MGNAYSLEKLHKMQNRTARVINGRSYEVRSGDYFTGIRLAAIDRKLERE